MSVYIYIYIAFVTRSDVTQKGMIPQDEQPRQGYSCLTNNCNLNAARALRRQRFLTVLAEREVRIAVKSENR